MTIKKTIFVLCSTLVLFHLAPMTDAQAATPTQTLRKLHNKINRLLKKKTPTGSPAEKRVKDQVRQAVNTLLDFQELAKRSLGKHWKERSEAEKEEFVQILQDLIERNYVKQLKSNLGYQLEYKKEEVDQEKALVQTVVKVKKDRRTTEIFIDYKMRKTNGTWMVYDVITDEVSIVRNYRSQFNRIIRKDSYEILVKKMRDKLQETT